MKPVTILHDSSSGLSVSRRKCFAWEKTPVLSFSKQEALRVQQMLCCPVSKVYDFICNVCRVMRRTGPAWLPRSGGWSYRASMQQHLWSRSRTLPSLLSGVPSQLPRVCCCSGKILPISARTPVWSHSHMHIFCPCTSCPSVKLDLAWCHV